MEWNPNTVKPRRSRNTGDESEPVLAETTYGEYRVVIWSYIDNEWQVCTDEMYLPTGVVEWAYIEHGATIGCNWKMTTKELEPDQYDWKSSCGEESVGLLTIEETPADFFNYCPGCGRKIKIENNE